MLPSKAEVESKQIAYSMAAVIRENLSNTVLDLEMPAGVNLRMKKGKEWIERVREFLKKYSPQIENKLISQIQELVSEVIKSQPPDKNKLDVFITASELQGIPPEKLTNLKLTLQEADRSWTQIQTEKGEIKNKLVPY